jgi:hypothetical protein
MLRERESFALRRTPNADSIQITLGQVMRMIVCRQVDSKAAGLLLYALQIASANWRRTRFEPYHRYVHVDLDRVAKTNLGDDAWSPSDFANVARTPSSAKGSLPDKKSAVAELPSPLKETHVARTPSSATESSSERKSPVPELPSSPKETHIARTPSSANEPSPAASLPSDAQHRELQKAERAMTGALKGDWRDLKTLFEFTGIFPCKDDDVPTTDP